MEALKQMPFTIEDIYDLPEGERAELINGRIYMMAHPSTRHQRLIQFFVVTIGTVSYTHLDVYKRQALS